jgi:hypothetical protein
MTKTGLSVDGRGLKSMNRRQLFKAAGVALSVGMIGQALPARGQSEDNQEPKPFLLEYPGQTLAASRDFEATGLRPGALTFDFTVLDFDHEKEAKAAYLEVEKNFLQDFGGFREVEFYDTSEASAPKVGDDRSGLVTKAMLEGTEALFALLFVHAGARVHVWGAIGLGDPYVELAAVAEAVFAQDPATPIPAEGTPQASANLLALLPDLDDLPPGFTMAEEKVRRPGDEE